MPVSPREFETVLVPEVTLRRCVLLCGCAAAATGTLIVLAMPLSGYLKIPLASLWLLDSLRELRALKRGAMRLHELRLDARGNITAIGREGGVEPLTLLSGSMVLKKLAWLRVRFPDGLKHGELLRGDAGRDPEWQRLQLIWRHRRGAFGRQDGS